MAFRLPTIPAPPTERDESGLWLCLSGSWRAIQALPRYPNSSQGLCSGELQYSNEAQEVWMRCWCCCVALCPTRGSQSPAKSHVHVLKSSRSFVGDGGAGEWLSLSSQSLPSQASMALPRCTEQVLSRAWSFFIFLFKIGMRYTNKYVRWMLPSHRDIVLGLMGRSLAGHDCLSSRLVVRPCAQSCAGNGALCRTHIASLPEMDGNISVFQN